MLVDKKWYPKVTEGENERKDRIKWMKEKVQWIKGQANDIKKEITPMLNAYQAYESWPVGGGRINPQ